MIEIDIIKPLYTADGIINLKVNKKINKGDFLTLFGKSGSGKTTLLRILAGLETPKSGKIVVDKEIWFDSSKKINLAPQKRDVGFVFQDYALFPNMSVKKNLEFALKNKNEIKKVDEILEIMEIKNLSNMKPELLSGGQKQRVALARALITHPKIILADEPTGALDSKSTDQLLSIFDQIHQSGQTILMVTHSSKAASYASRVLFIKDGQIFHQLYKGDMSNQEMYQAISDTLTMLLSGGQ